MFMRTSDTASAGVSDTDTGDTGSSRDAGAEEAEEAEEAEAEEAEEAEAEEAETEEVDAEEGTERCRGCERKRTLCVGADMMMPARMPLQRALFKQCERGSARAKRENFIFTRYTGKLQE
jgi:hypothetical protein